MRSLITYIDRAYRPSASPIADLKQLHSPATASPNIRGICSYFSLRAAPSDELTAFQSTSSRLSRVTDR